MRQLLLATLSILVLSGTAPADGVSAQSPASPKNAPTRRFASAAHKALAEGQPRQVLDLLDARTAQLPPAERHSLAGRAHLALRDYAMARRELVSATRMRPQHAGDQFTLGLALLNCGSPVLAAARFEQAQWRGLESAELHLAWSHAFRDAGQVLGKVSRKRWRDGPIESAEPGVFAFGGIVVGQNRRKPGYVAVSPPASAIFHAYRSLALGSDETAPLSLLAELWAACKRHDLACAFFKKAADQLVGERKAKCLQGWAESLLATDRFDAYLKKTRESMQLDGGVDSAKLAGCYDRAAREVGLRGEQGRQIRYLKLAAELRPEPDRLVTLSDALMNARRYADALACLHTALEKGPTRRQRNQIRQRIDRTSYLTAPR